MHKRDDIRFHNGSFVHARKFQRGGPTQLGKSSNELNSFAHVYEVRPPQRSSRRQPVSDALPFGALWYGEPMQSRTQPATQSFTAVHMML